MSEQPEKQPQNEGPLLREIKAATESLEARIKEQERLLYGDPRMRFAGLAAEVESLNKIIQGLVQQQVIEEAERRGMKRLITYTGITSAASLITLLMLLWQSGLLSG